MQEEWKDVPTFPNYRVSNLGRVESVKTGRILQPTKNQQGHLKVNLARGGEVYTRTINHLVAKQFIPPPNRPDFISIIHLDGNKSNCRADNLMWRPRHFAVEYHLQFRSHNFRTSKIEIIEVKTGEKYKTIQEAAVKFGLLFNDILISAHQLTYVWPTYQQFRTIHV